MKSSALITIAFLLTLATSVQAQDRLPNCIAHTNGGQRQKVEVKLVANGVKPETTTYNIHQVAAGWIANTRTLIMTIDGYSSITESVDAEGVYRLAATDGAEVLCFGR